MLLSRHQNAEQNHDIKIANRSFENVAQVGYLGTTFTDQNLIQEKIKYLLLSHHQSAGQNHDIKIANRYFENVAQFRYLGTTITNQNLIQEEMKRRWNSGSAC
jgi:hypothetical protein